MKELPSGRHIPLSEMVMKKGVVKTPLSAALENLVPNSWRKNRLIEYLWIAIILEKEGPGNGLRVLIAMSNFIKDKKLLLDSLKMSRILDMKYEDKALLFRYIHEENLAYAFYPFIPIAFTNIQMKPKYKSFLDSFFEGFLNLDPLFNRLEKVIEQYMDPKSEKATYLRFCTMTLAIVTGHFVLQKGRDEDLADEFIMISRGDSFEIEPYFASKIRAMELAVSGLKNETSWFTEDFNKFMARYVPCDIKTIEQSSETSMITFDQIYKSLFNSLRDCISQNHELMITSKKFQIMTASLQYGLRIFKEVNQVGFNSVVSIELMRSILETFVNNKFLLESEKNHEDIWESFQKYGESALRKLAAESDKYSSKRLPSAYDSRFINIMSAESDDEMMGDIDLKYFGNTNIRKKFQKVDLEFLYQTYYEYGTQFTHGYWSAVRIAVTDFCDQPLHESHSNTELNEQISLNSTFDDYVYILSLWSKMLFDEFPVNKEGDD